MMSLRLLSGLMAVLFVSAARSDDSVIYLKSTEADALKAKEGQKVMVYGETSDSEKSPSGTNFVNFKGAEFYLVTFKTDLKLFPEGEPVELYDDKRVAVTGVMSIYQDKPQFKLTSPDQVKVLEADEEFPPKQAKEEPVSQPEPKPEPAPAAEPKPEEEPKRKPPVDPSEYFK